VDVVRDFVRGAVQVHALYHAAEGDVYGAALIEELGRHGHRLSPGTLYPLLHRLESAGLIRSRSVVVDGRVRRIYRATPQGRAALRRCQLAVRELAVEVLGAE
jgi:DNA-binding PadR family transcriptional regulator